MRKLENLIKIFGFKGCKYLLKIKKQIAQTTLALVRRPATLLKQDSNTSVCVQVLLKKRFWQRCFPDNFAKF